MAGEVTTLLVLFLLPALASNAFKRQINDLKTAGQLDFVFLVDGSSSVGSENFDSELGFVKKLLSDFTVSENRTKVAVVVFGSHAHVYEHGDKCELLNAVLPTIKYPGGGTNTLGAFLAARELISFGRPEAEKVVFLVTDGFSNGGDPIPIAEELKDTYNATIFTIGIRTGNKLELEQLASEENTTYLLESFSEFDLLARKALHTDLRDGDYVPVEPIRCPGGCDELAACTCGTSSGQYACRCKPGHYGTGKIGECAPCPIGTWHNSKTGICTPCPDVNHITNTTPPPTSQESCICKLGFKKSEDKCEVMKCPALEAPEHGYFVGGASCPNVLNNACGVRCNVGYSLRGNSIRVCRITGHWDGIEPQCHLKTCPRPPIPVGGKVECANEDLDIQYHELPDEMPVDTECGYKCSPGHSLVGSHRRTCLPVAQWDGLKTTCKPLRCIRLSKIPHGKSLPESCAKEKQEHGSKCTIVCETGFSGPGDIECVTKGRLGAWSSKPRCLDNEPPKLHCPEDVRANAELGASYGMVSWKDPAVTDNSGALVNVWWEPSGEEDSNGGPHKFEIGKTVVTYHAVDANGNGASCNFSVYVHDLEPPQFENCENPPPYLVGGEGVVVEWDEPTGFDNSGSEITISKSQDFGTLREGVTPILYTAVDQYNNSNTCEINITVQFTSCETQMPTPGDCNEVPGGVLCVLTCEEGYAFPVTDKASCDHSHPVWTVPDCTPTEIPEEVSGEINKTDACPELVQKCREEGCEVLDCEGDNRIKRQTEIQERRTRFRLKLGVKEDIEHRFGGLNLVSPLRPICRNGSVPVKTKKLRCAKCPRGTYHNFTIRKCEPCAIDQYNDKIGATKCEVCPNGRATRGRRGSKSIKACKIRLGAKFRPVVRKEPCRNGTCTNGKCIPVGASRHKCVCNKGWVGARCRLKRINHCATEPCLNGGSCTTTDSSLGYTCACPNGFHGDNCDLEALEEQPQILAQVNICKQVDTLCENGGTCQVDNSSGGGYKCVCSPGYMGRRCQVVPCDYRPCPENAVCLNVPESGKETTRESFKCECPKGRDGPPHCLEITDECGGCKNNGTCLNGVCVCSKIWTGSHCEEKLTSDYILHFPVSGTSDFAQMKAPVDDLNELTVCAWIETNNTFNYGTILSYATPDLDNALTIIDYGGLVLWVNGQYEVTKAKINDGSWHHVCLTWSKDLGEYKVFVDSIIKASGSGLSRHKSIQGGGTFVLGQEQDFEGGGFSRIESFVGKISHVDVWRRKLEMAAIRHNCGKYEGGDLMSWPEFRKGVNGNTKVVSSHFCSGCEIPKDNVTFGEMEIKENGAVLTLTCQKGYVVLQQGGYPLAVSTLTRTCEASGRWQNQDRAWFCVRVQCTQPPRVAYGRISSRRKRLYRYDDEVVYQCHEGYELHGNATKTCLEDSTWSGGVLECIGNHCDPFNPPEDANITIVSEHVYDEDFKDISRFEVGTVIEVSCLEEQFLLTCLENRTWEGQLPKCRKEVPGCEGVEAPSIPNNGYLTDPNFDNLTIYEVSTTVSYRCRNGYDLVGVNYTTCLEDGTWSIPEVSCEPVRCPNPPKYANMYPKKQSGVSSYHFGNIVYYECEPGFSFYGNNVARCLANGRWSRVKGKCARISCGKPTLADDDEVIIGSSYLYKDSLHIMCPGDAARDYYEAKCTHTGQWLYLGNCHTPKEPKEDRR